MMRCLIAIVTCLTGPLVSAGDAGVKLPQDHEYQIELRNYLAARTEADYRLAVEPILFEDRWVGPDDDLHRLWILTRNLPTARGLTMPADRFLLARIESPEGIRLRTGDRGSIGSSKEVPGIAVHPDDTVWWAAWDYPGNPYRGSAAVRNRAFAMAAVDMIMLDRLHESGKHWVGNARRSDFLGGTVAWLAHVYHDVGAELPAPVRKAYETGLAKFVARLNEWGPTGVCDNMDMKALVGMAYIGATLPAGDLAEQARGYVNRVLRHVHPAGIVRDAGGVEASYNGIALFDMAWATSVMPWPELLETQRRMSDLKAHLTLPEPDGRNFWGPTHFSTRTSADSANDQWAFPQRDIAIAMRTDEALYLMFGGRNGRAGCWAAPDREVMLQEVQKSLAVFNQRELAPSEAEFTTWQASWWGSGRLNYADAAYPPGFYGRLRGLWEAEDPRVLPPVVRPAASFQPAEGPASAAAAAAVFIRGFPDPAQADVAAADRDAFLIARYGDYAAVIFTGPVGFTSYMNFAGGALSAFWTPAAGSLVLGRTGLPTKPAQTRQDWNDWRLWPTHALSGQTPSGDAFSSARLRRRVSEVEYDIGPTRATVRVSGPLGKPHDEGRTVQNGCLTGAVRYARRFDLDARGVAIETVLESDGTDSVTDLCEILPLPVKDMRLQVPPHRDPEAGEVHHRVRFQTAAGLLEPPEGEAFVDGVTAVEVERFGGSGWIRFEAPCRVRLGEPWTDSYMSRMMVRNLLIDLLGKRDGPVPLPSVAIRYRIEAGPAVAPPPAAAEDPPPG